MRFLLLPLLIGLPLLLTAEPVKDHETQALEKQLNAWMIPELAFEQATIGDCLSYLHQICMNKGRAENQVVNIVAMDTISAEPVSLKLKNVSVLQALETICEKATCRYELKGNIVYLHAKPVGKPPVPRPPHKVEDALKKLIIPNLSVERASLKDVLTYLTLITKQQGRVVRFTSESKRPTASAEGFKMPKGFFDDFGGKAPAGNAGAAKGPEPLPPINLTLRQVSVYEILEIICSQTGTAWNVGQGVIVIKDER